MHMFYKTVVLQCTSHRNIHGVVLFLSHSNRVHVYCRDKNLLSSKSIATSLTQLYALPWHHKVFALVILLPLKLWANQALGTYPYECLWCCSDTGNFRAVQINPTSLLQMHITACYISTTLVVVNMPLFIALGMHMHVCVCVCVCV